MNSSGTFLVFRTPRAEAQRMIEGGLAVRQDARRVLLTCHPTHGGIGKSNSLYHEGHTLMHGRYYAPTRSFLRW